MEAILTIKRFQEMVDIYLKRLRLTEKCKIGQSSEKDICENMDAVLQPL